MYLFGPPGTATGCGGPAGEEDDGYHSYVGCDDSGNRNRAGAAAAVRRLYCGA
jgi:hypothetical protein